MYSFSYDMQCSTSKLSLNLLQYFFRKEFYYKKEIGKTHTDKYQNIFFAPLERRRMVEVDFGTYVRLLCVGIHSRTKHSISC